MQEPKQKPKPKVKIRVKESEPADPRRSKRSSASNKRYFEDEDDEVRAKRRRTATGGKVYALNLMPSTSGRNFDPNAEPWGPDRITDEMLENVADRVSEKVHDGDNGTSCHQCRQKTLDMKTICRSGVCSGVRGFFCGVCLQNRYGQEIRKVLLDPEWACPPCRGKCNCSICRNKAGKGATGVCTNVAQVNGFNSVEDFLDSLRR